VVLEQPIAEYHCSLMLHSHLKSLWWFPFGAAVFWVCVFFFFLQSQAKHINKFMVPQTFFPQDYLALLGAQAMYESSHNSSRGPETKNE